MKKILIALALVLTLGLMSPQVTMAQNSSELLARIAELMELVENLQTQLSNMRKEDSSWCHTFERNLRIGDSGSEVSALNKVLAKQGYTTSQTSYFGEATASAVVSFQERYRSEVLGPHGLYRGTGYVGATTRAKLNHLYGCEIEGDVLRPTPWYTANPELDYVQAPAEDRGVLHSQERAVVYGSGLDEGTVLVRLEKNGSQHSAPLYDIHEGSASFTVPVLPEGNYDMYLYRVEDGVKTGTINTTVKEVVVYGNPELDHVQAHAEERNVLHTGERVMIYGSNLDIEDLTVVLSGLGGRYEIDTYNTSEGSANFTVPSDLSDGNYRLLLLNPVDELFSGGIDVIVESFEVCGDGVDNDNDQRIDENCWSLHNLEVASGLSFGDGPRTNEGDTLVLEWDISGTVTPGANIEFNFYDKTDYFVKWIGATEAEQGRYQFTVPNMTVPESVPTVKIKASCESPDYSAKHIAGCVEETQLFDVHD